jgi:hypothetical protein
MKKLVKERNICFEKVYIGKGLYYMKGLTQERIVRGYL